MIDITNPRTVQKHITFFAHLPYSENIVFNFQNMSWADAVDKATHELQAAWCKEYGETECPHDAITDCLVVSDSPITYIGT